MIVPIHMVWWHKWQTWPLSFQWHRRGNELLFVTPLTQFYVGWLESQVVMDFFMVRLFQVANHHQMASVTSVQEPYNQDRSSRRSVIGHNWLLNDKLWLSDYAVCLLHEQWQQCLIIIDFSCWLGCKKFCCLFFAQNDRPAKWRWCQIYQHCRKLWWSSYIETAAEMLHEDGSSKVAWPLRPCNVCLLFTWHRAKMKIEEFLMVVCCLESHRFITDRT